MPLSPWKALHACDPLHCLRPRETLVGASAPRSNPQLCRLSAWPECAATHSSQERAQPASQLLGLESAPALLLPNTARRASSPTTSAHQPREAAQHRQNLPSRVTRIPPRRPEHRPAISATHSRHTARRLPRPRRPHRNAGRAPTTKQNVPTDDHLDVGLLPHCVTTGHSRPRAGSVRQAGSPHFATRD